MYFKDKSNQGVKYTLIKIKATLCKMLSFQ